VALGSPAGYSVQPAHRLLWPHPSLWPGAPAYVLSRHVPPFQSFPNLLRVSFGRVALLTPAAFRMPSTASSPVVMPSPSSEKLGVRSPLPFGTAGRLTRLQVSLHVTTRSFASAAPPARLRPSSRPAGSLRRTWVMTKRATVHSRCRTFPGQTRSIMGCTRRQRRVRGPQIGRIRLRLASAFIRFRRDKSARQVGNVANANTMLYHWRRRRKSIC